jgi:hypothetical protein
MLAEHDTLVLPPGVRLGESGIVDDVRDLVIPANAAGLVVLAGVGATLATTIEQFGERWNLAAEESRRDVLRFAWQLNRLGLVNVRHAVPRRGRALGWLSVATRTLPFGRLPEREVCRRPLDMSSRLRATRSTAQALALRVVLVALLASAALLGTGAAAGGIDVVGSLVVGSAAGLAILVHELGHVLALGRTPAAMLLVGGRTSVVHRREPSGRAALIALAGPAGAVLSGMALSTFALAMESSLLAIAACPIAGHALAATVAARDGRTACGLDDEAGKAGGTGGPRHVGDRAGDHTGDARGMDEKHQEVVA